VDGLVTNDENVGKLMLDRDTWRSKISMLEILVVIVGAAEPEAILLFSIIKLNY
jgi:hypothetical protein